MGLFKKIGKVVGKGLKLASNVLPPGLRQVAALGGSVLGGGNMRAHLGSVAKSFLPGLGGLIGKIPGVGGLAGKLPALGGLFGKVGDFAKNNPDLLLGGAQAVMGGLDARKAGKLSGRALDRYGNTHSPDLTSTFEDAGNPYYRPVRLPKLGGVVQ